NEERARILRMVAEGKVTPAEAEDLLAALDAAPEASARLTGPSATFGPRSMPVPPVPVPGPPGFGRRRRSLVIQGKEGGDAEVYDDEDGELLYFPQPLDGTLYQKEGAPWHGALG